MFFVSKNAEPRTHCIYLYHHAPDTLHTHCNHSLRTFFRSRSASVADSMLGLQTEQKAGREAVDVINTIIPGVVVDIFYLQVSVRVRNQPPDTSKCKPT